MLESVRCRTIALLTRELTKHDCPLSASSRLVNCGDGQKGPGAK